MTIQVEPNGVHRMIFPYPTSGLRIGSWTWEIFKDGTSVERPISVNEFPTKNYIFTFQNDGKLESVWTLIVNKTGENKFFVEDWKVKSLITEQVSKELRAKSSGGGFFGSR